MIIDGRRLTESERLKFLADEEYAALADMFDPEPPNAPESPAQTDTPAPLAPPAAAVREPFAALDSYALAHPQGRPAVESAAFLTRAQAD